MHQDGGAFAICTFVKISANIFIGFGAGNCVDEDAENASRPAGVDWKALVIPALLPISTDFAPKKEDFEKEYFINEYSVRRSNVLIDDLVC